MNSTVGLGSAILGGVVAFIAGYVYRAVTTAFADLKAQKAKIKDMRKDAWSWLWTMIKAGTIAAIVLIGYVAWVVRDVQG